MVSLGGILTDCAPTKISLAATALSFYNSDTQRPAHGPHLVMWPAKYKRITNDWNHNGLWCQSGDDQHPAWYPKARCSSHSHHNDKARVSGWSEVLDADLAQLVRWCDHVNWAEKVCTRLFHSLVTSVLQQTLWPFQRWWPQGAKKGADEIKHLSRQNSLTDIQTGGNNWQMLNIRHIDNGMATMAIAIALVWPLLPLAIAVVSTTDLCGHSTSQNVPMPC